MNYHRTFFVFLVLFAAAVVLAGGLPFYGKWLFIVCAAFAGAALLKRFSLSPWKELEASLHRIKRRPSGAARRRGKGETSGRAPSSSTSWRRDLAKKYKKLYENMGKEAYRPDKLGQQRSDAFFNPIGEMLLANANMSGNFAHFRKDAR